MASSFSMGMRSRVALGGQGTAVGGAVAQDTGTASLRLAHDTVGNSGVLAGIGGADQGYLFSALMGGLMAVGDRPSNTTMQRALRGSLFGDEHEDAAAWAVHTQSTDGSAKARLQSQAMRLGAFSFSVPAPVQGATELAPDHVDYAAPERAVESAVEAAPAAAEATTAAA